ncbi:MAG TPA: mannosyltransferase family protein, partial [Gaiellaceae bacterium]
MGRLRTLAASADFRFVVAVWALSRLFFLVVGALGHAHLTQASPGGFPREPSGAFNYWANWDGGWYTTIAREGYFNAASTSFFPLYPIAIWLGTRLGGGTAIWGIAISVAALLPTLWFLYELTERLFERRAARAAVLAFALFPSAFFLNAVYTESLFLLTSVGCIWALRVRRNLVLGCIFAYFAMLTRNVGVFLIVPLAWHWFQRRRELGWSSALFVGFSASGLVAYMYYLWQVRSDPLYFAVAQRETWGRAFANPIDTLGKAWSTGLFGARYAFHPHVMFAGTNPEPAFKAADTFNLILLFVLVFLLVLAIRRLPLELWLYSALVMAAPILTPS